MSIPNFWRARKTRRAVLAAATGVVMAVGAGVGVAHAVTSSPAAQVAPASASVDRPEPGDTPDTPGAADQTDRTGQPDRPEPGDTPDTGH
ncbi:hypothetical protein AAFP30_24425 [Gordonia sp. CPCC 205515]|uniref:hypothetical protein n=1 Tax=Gordonia sp. CPCC 205515 TaxID=3140791 RepID=UPI003AF33A49